MFNIMFQMGGSSKQLARRIPVWLGAASVSTLPLLIVIPWARMEDRQAERPFIISEPVFFIYTLVAMIAIVIFWLPVKHTLHQILKYTK